MEEIFRNYKSFVEEKRNLKEQIDKIERKRNELAKERNSKKAANKENNDEEIWSEINCLGRQISDLGNQSQWFQNQIDSKLISIKEQAYLEINSLIAEEMRKIRIINEQIEENENCSGDINTVYEEKNSISRIEENISNLLWIKKMIKYGEINRILTEENQRQQNKEQNETEASEVLQTIEEIKVEEFKPEEEPFKVEEFEPQLDEIKIDEINIDKFEDIEEPKIEKDVVVEDFSQLEDEIIKTLQEQLAKEDEIITFEENTSYEETPKIVEPITIQNIIIKVEDKTIVYKAEISDGTTMKIYPIKERKLENEKNDRKLWKEAIIKYAATTYKNYYSNAVRKMDPIICELLERFAIKYNKDSEKMIYNYVMSFANVEVSGSEQLPKIIYNLSYSNEIKMTKHDLKTMQKIVKNANKNVLIETIGTISFAEKIKCLAKRIFNLNNVKALTEGSRDNL